MRAQYRLAKIAAIVVFAGLLYWGMGRWPTGPAAGGPIAAPPGTQPAGPPARLRLRTFNIHSGIGLDNREDLDRIAGVLEGSDLVALQEVSGDRPWIGNQATLLADRLKMSALFSSTETHWWYPVFGNGILTRVPVRHWARTPLTNGYHMANRHVLHLEVPFGGGTLNVLAVHMGKKTDRAQQFADVRRMFLDLPEPCVLMGDLNTRPYDPMMQDLLTTTDAHDVVGERIAPVDRVDFILTRGLRCTDAGLAQNDASDHPCAWADIEAMP